MKAIAEGVLSETEAAGNTGSGGREMVVAAGTGVVVVAIEGKLP